MHGYTYHRKNEYGDKIYWRCAHFRSGECNATAITREGKNGTEILKEGEHEHPPESDEEQESELESLTDEASDEQSHSEEDAEIHEWAEKSISDTLSAESEDDDEEDDEIQEWEVWQEESETEDMPSGSEGDTDEEKMEGESDALIGFHHSQKALKLYKNDLRNLSAESLALRQVVLKEADKGLICYLCEICWNLAKGFFYLNKYEKNLLRLIEDNMCMMTNKNITWKTKKAELIEMPQDHFLPILLNVALPHLS